MSEKPFTIKSDARAAAAAAILPSMFIGLFEHGTGAIGSVLWARDRQYRSVPSPGPIIALPGGAGRGAFSHHSDVVEASHA